MLVRAKVTHFRNSLRKEGDEFEHSGPLYEHIEPAEPVEKERPNKQAKPRQGEE
jgi:hypothetical protein